MEREDLILEGVKNSLEAGASSIDVYIWENGFAIVDDGSLETIPSFKNGASSKGEKRGRGLFLLSEATKGRCGIERINDRTVLKAFFERKLEAEKIIPFCFNLTSLVTYHCMRDGREAYYLDVDILDKMDIDPRKAGDVARLKKIIREKEQRSL